MVETQSLVADPRLQKILADKFDAKYADAQGNIVRPITVAAQHLIDVLDRQKTLAELGRDLVAILLEHAGERGDNEGAVECLKRILRENAVLERLIERIPTLASSDAILTEEERAIVEQIAR